MISVHHKLHGKLKVGIFDYPLVFQSVINMLSETTMSFLLAGPVRVAQENLLFWN